MDSLEIVQWAPVYAVGTSAKSSEAGGRWVQVGSIPEDGEGDEDKILWEVLDGGGVELEPNQYRSAIGRRPLVVDAVLREGERRRGHP